MLHVTKWIAGALYGPSFYRVSFFIFVFIFFRVDPKRPGHFYNQPKFIIFYDMLLQIFSLFCFNCKAERPKVSMLQTGTMVTVRQQCVRCIKGYVWNSQPYMPQGKYPVGNMLLSFSVLMAGASISKVLLVLQHMGVCCYAGRTFFRHQKDFVVPVILNYWESYRADLVNKLKNVKDAVWTGDGRFDSMGHSAKYGVYTMLCTTIMKIFHFEIVQV